ncbi:MAG: hypothetical protein ACSHXK_07315 [Oceanococcus sp.]
MKSYLLALFTIAALPYSTNILASDIGDMLPIFSMQDQSGNEHSLDDNTRRIYANNSRGGGKLMEAAMKDLDQSHLDQQNALVIAEISKAPGFVKRMISSGLKDRGYNTLVDKKGVSRKFVRYVSDRVTIIELQQRQIIAIRNISDTEELKKELLQVLETQEPASPEETPAPTSSE